MAREFILFVHICQWIGGETAVPFKTSPGWLTDATEARWKTPVMGCRRRPPGGCVDLPLYCLTSFSPRNPSILSPLDFTPQEESPIMDTCLFTDSEYFCAACTCSKQICLPNRRGNRKKREKHWQPQSHNKSMPRVWWGLRTPGSSSSPSKSW